MGNTYRNVTVRVNDPNDMSYTEKFYSEYLENHPYELNLPWIISIRNLPTFQIQAFVSNGQLFEQQSLSIFPSTVIFNQIIFDSGPTSDPTPKPDNKPSVKPTSRKKEPLRRELHVGKELKNIRCLKRLCL
mgnify:FL=1